MKKILRSKKAFTLLELIVVLAIVSLIAGFSLTNLSTSQTKNNFSIAFDVLMSDIKEQQMKAMVGNVGIGITSAASYGVHFDQTKYTLFQGSSYDSSTNTNFVVNFDSTVEIVTPVNLPSSNVIFSQASGQVSGFNSNQNTVTVRNKVTQTTQVIKFNKFGTFIP